MKKEVHPHTRPLVRGARGPLIPFSPVLLKPSRAVSREAAREAGGRTRSTRGCCAAPPTPPAEHLLRAGRWDTHPFNAGHASLLHVTYAPPEPGPGFTLSDTPESLFPPTRALSRSRTAWAESLCWAESLSAEHAAAHLTERAWHCPLSARTHLCPAGGPSAAPAPRQWEARPRGRAPGPPLLPRPWPARPAASTCGASAPLAACAPGAGPVPVRTLPQAPPACRSAGSSLVTSEFVNAGCVYNAVSSFFFCSHGWCAFYDFREVFLCSRKCKCHA